jgi:GDP-L-fucose synthase
MNIDKETYNQHTSMMRSHINVGSGKDLTIKELAQIIKDVVGYKGKINFDPTKPDGSIRKFLDSGIINSFGFNPEISLTEGLIKTYQDYIKAEV